MPALKRRFGNGRKGFTLIEILIAIAISGIALVSLMGVFEYQQKSYQKTSELVQIQQNLRTGMQFIVQDLRMVAFTGLALGFDRLPEPSGTSIVPNSPVYPILSLKAGDTTMAGVSGVDMFSHANAFDGSTNLDVLTGTTSDIVEIWGNFTRNWTTFPTGTNYSAGQANIAVADPSILIDNKIDWILIGNASSISAHQVNSTVNQTSGAVTISPAIPIDYFFANSIVAPYQRRVYFVNNQHIEKNGVRTPQLIRRTYINNGAVPTNPTFDDQVIADYVTELHLEYIVQTSGNMQLKEDLRMVKDTPYNNPCAVRGVRITLKAIEPTLPTNAAVKREMEEKKAGYLSVERQLSQVVRLRNLGIQKTQCAVP